MDFCVLQDQCTVWDRRLKIPGACYHTVLCEGCRSRSVSHLRMLRLDYVDLTQALPKVDRHSEVRIFRPKPQSMAPVDWRVFSLRDDIVRAAVCADEAVRAQHRLPALRWDVMRDGMALDHAVRHLEASPDLLARLTHIEGYVDPETGVSVDLSGPQMLLLFDALHRQARSVLGRASDTTTLPGVCPVCRASGLRCADTEPHRVQCRACKTSMDRQMYEQTLTMRTRP